MELNKKIAIHIISVESPNRFWFRTKENEQKINADIEAYMVSHLSAQTDCQFFPQLNERVIVKSKNRFEIAEIQKIDTASDKFVGLFASGKFREIKRHDFSPISKQLAKEANDTILMGSIVGLAPVKMDFSCRDTSAEMRKSHEWSNDSIDFFREIGRTCLVYFFPMRYDNECFYGEVSFVQEKSLSKIFLDINFAMLYECTEDETDGLDESHSDSKKSTVITDAGSAKISNVMIDATETVANGKNDGKYSTSNGSLHSTSLKPSNCTKSPAADDSSTPLSNSRSPLSKHSENDELKLIFGDFLSEHDELSDGLIAQSEQPLHVSTGNSSNPVDLAPTGDSTNQGDIFTVPDHLISSTLAKSVDCTEIDDSLSTISSGSNNSSIPSYLIKAGYDSEEDPNANQYKFEDSVKRDEEVNLSVRQQMIGTILKDAKLYEKEPSTNFIDQIDGQAACALADESLKRLNKIYPVQMSVWPHILSKRSATLIGNTDYYPHLLYLPAICDLIKADQSDEMDGPKVVILEHVRQQARDICRIGSCYLGVVPPSSLVYFNDEYDLNDLNVKQLSQCEIFVTMTHHICSAANPEEYFPKTVQCVVINDFQMVPSEQRQILIKMLHSIKLPFIITSRYYTEELRQLIADVPEMFVSMESHFDQYYLSSEDGDTRTTEICKVKPNQKRLQLRTKLIKLSNLNSNKRVVVVCTTEETAKYISNTIFENFKLENIVNQTPGKYSPRIVICSDDHLLELSIKSADHIIHYDLPDSFEIFSLRYSVFTKSHSILRAVGGTDAASSKKPNKSTSSSTVFYVPGNNQNNDTHLMLSLLAREYTLSLSASFTSQLYEMGRTLNDNNDSPMCNDISGNFENIDHLLKCKNRHYFKSESIPQEPKFTESTHCLVQVLHAVSPIWFEMRVIKHKDSNGDWCNWDFSEQFDKFRQDLNEFQKHSFVPIKTIPDEQKDTLFVLRKGDQFSRCIILDKNVAGNMQKVRVKLVDFGVPRVAAISDIGCLDEQFAKFPKQSVSLCLLDLSPWNQHAWDDDDKRYVTNLLGINRDDNRYEIHIQHEMQPDLFFTTNLCSPEIDYAAVIISKGIARKNISTDFMRCLKEMKYRA